MHSGSYSDSSDKWKSDSTKCALSSCYVRHVISYWRVTGEPRRCFPLSLDRTHTPLVVGSALSTLMFISFSSIGSVRRDVAVNVDTQPLHPLTPPPHNSHAHIKYRFTFLPAPSGSLHNVPFPNPILYVFILSYFTSVFALSKVLKYQRTVFRGRATLVLRQTLVSLLYLSLRMKFYIVYVRSIINLESFVTYEVY